MLLLARRLGGSGMSAELKFSSLLVEDPLSFEEGRLLPSPEQCSNESQRHADPRGPLAYRIKAFIAR